MKLKTLIEELKDIKTDPQKALKMMGVGSPATTQVAQAQQVKEKADKEAKKSRTKDFHITFKDDNGYFKVKVRSTEDGLKYNYGYYNQKTMPTINVNSENLTKEGKKRYDEFKAYVAALKRTSSDSDGGDEKKEEKKEEKGDEK